MQLWLFSQPQPVLWVVHKGRGASLYHWHCCAQLPPPALLEELAAEELATEELDNKELDAIDELDELLLSALLLESGGVTPPYTLAFTDVFAMPLTPLIKRRPHGVRLLGLKLFTISSATQQLPLPDQDQPR